MKLINPCSSGGGGGAITSAFISSTNTTAKTRTNDGVNWMDIDGATESSGTMPSGYTTDDLGAITYNNATADHWFFCALTTEKPSTNRVFEFQFLVDGVPVVAAADSEVLGGGNEEMMMFFAKASIPSGSVVTAGLMQVSSDTLTYLKMSFGIIAA